MPNLWEYKNTHLKHWKIVCVNVGGRNQFSLLFLYFRSRFKILINFRIVKYVCFNFKDKHYTI